MNYSRKLQYHYHPKKGWINDPNGLVYFDGYYHVFYQHAPDFEVPGQQPIHWGHARTKDFLNWEELPIALYPEHEYEKDGCWSGTAAVKDGVLYLFYASVKNSPNGEKTKIQTVSVAYSTDGIHFKKYEGNPVIAHYPKDGGPDFRDPAVCIIDGVGYCVMASGNPESRTARLLLYKSEDLLHWNYVGIMSEWQEGRWTECPSFVPADDRYLLTVSVSLLEQKPFFSVMYGQFKSDVFVPEYSAEVDKGPDQYAGLVFHDHLGRNLLVSWIPGWRYCRYAENDVGCLSIPRELKLEGGRITAYPPEELRHLLQDEDPALARTSEGFTVERTNRAPLVYRGEIRDLKILRDGYVMEIFVNGGEEVYSVLL